MGSVIKFGGLQLSAQLLVRGPVSCDPHRQLLFAVLQFHVVFYG